MNIDLKNRAAEPLTVQPRFIHRALRQPEPAPKVVTFGIHRLQKRTDSVSETVSESSKMIVRNRSGLERFSLDFTGVYAILLELNRTLQVPPGHRKSASHKVAEKSSKKNLRPERTPDCPKKFHRAVRHKIYFYPLPAAS
jgi:hypothetical protein